MGLEEDLDGVCIKARVLRFFQGNPDSTGAEATDNIGKTYRHKVHNVISTFKNQGLLKLTGKKAYARRTDNSYGITDRGIEELDKFRNGLTAQVEYFK